VIPAVYSNCNPFEEVYPLLVSVIFNTSSLIAATAVIPLNSQLADKFPYTVVYVTIQVELWVASITNNVLE